MPQLVEEEGGAECALLVAVGMANGLHRVDALAARALEAWRHRREAVACGGGRQCRAHGAGDEEEGEGAGRWGYARGGVEGVGAESVDWTGAVRGERRVEVGGSDGNAGRMCNLWQSRPDDESGRWTEKKCHP